MTCGEEMSKPYQYVLSRSAKVQALVPELVLAPNASLVLELSYMTVSGSYSRYNRQIGEKQINRYHVVQQNSHRLRPLRDAAVHRVNCERTGKALRRRKGTIPRRTLEAVPARVHMAHQ